MFSFANNCNVNIDNTIAYVVLLVVFSLYIFKIITMYNPIPFGNRKLMGAAVNEGEELWWNEKEDGGSSFNFMAIYYNFRGNYVDFIDLLVNLFSIIIIFRLATTCNSWVLLLLILLSKEFLYIFGIKSIERGMRLLMGTTIAR
jgi:hypothetical protein